MLSDLLSLHLISGPVPTIVRVAGVIALVSVLISRRPRRWLPIAGIVSFGGLGLGYALCWLLGDVLDLFGVDLSLVTRTWFAVLVAGLALGIARACVAGAGPKVLGAAVAIVAVLVGSIGINADLGEFPTVRAVFGGHDYRPIALPALGTTRPVAGWSAPSDLPHSGRVGSAVIPPVHSHFAARDALVYLPPAALVTDPARLPVLVMLSGQPGSPSDLFTSGALATHLDTYARAHAGLAPIVVVPDQLGAPGRNPMCVDGALGNSATYVLRDVSSWIHAHLNVLGGAASWGIGGFSQGGTCAIQFGAAHPERYGSILDISGEVAPKRGTLQQTIDAGFGGSRGAYEAAVPAAIMKRHGAYDGTFAQFCVGADDARYGPGLRTVAREATNAGMQTTLDISPGTAHDWHTVQYALSRMIPALGAHWRLGGAGA